MTNEPFKVNQEHQSDEIDSVLAKVRQALSKIRYGAVEIVIHNSRVVQIEAREKIRFDLENKNPDQSSGSGALKK